MKPNELKCETCDYLWPDGTCRARAAQPQVVIVLSGFSPPEKHTIIFPPAPMDGCGEHSEFGTVQYDNRMGKREYDRDDY